jgi:hypothetical protein
MPDTEDDVTADVCAARDHMPGLGAGHGEIAGCRGYTLDRIDRLAYIAVRYRREGYGFGVVSFEDRQAVATAAIAEALCAGDEERPPEQALIGAATQAVRRAVRAELSYRGISLIDGCSRIPAYRRYWWLGAQATRGPEEPVVESVALWQIWAALPPRCQRIFAALAEYEDYALAAKSLGITHRTFVCGISVARREFLRLWHEHETPSAPWGRDHRKKPGAKRREKAERVGLQRRRRSPKRVLRDGRREG